ncbi:iron-sulfur cluster biosynthesis transcriptional regulator SufR [Roseofilum casamattae]|uniref:Iron-sulfur cluster biosynthesis transcriptional regulator SufR n=1 Tax=Roseofilum casamattae BLCC-M143 TaxID=3022442 RepID=A0ABT7C016_9CYAN|nr:iron-sulfur cluster biosynthesis transcriptional regulator SufR [Roseofilum casamattae]MDJ1184655.1 iron-sulfur cluster biosynthesis transcriptional regulator SufR [Roseofilum casamattae BLCC-M143]
MGTARKISTKPTILEYLLKEGRATALQLAEVLEITPQAIRRHLKDLETEALIEYDTVRASEEVESSSMGRPQHYYRLSRKGRDRFPNNHGEFAVSLLDTLAEIAGREQVGSILQKQWQRKAQVYRDRLARGTVQERVAALVEMRKEEGYMAEWYAIESEGNDSVRFMLAEHHCAISDVAESFPTVCGHELKMFSELFEDCLVERTHWIIDGEHRCGYLIAPMEVRVEEPS